MNKIISTNRVLNFLLLWLLVCLTNCDGSTNNNSSTSSGGGSSSRMASIFPTDLVMASPYAESSGNASLSAMDRPFEVLQATTPSNDDYASKKAAIATMLSATSTNSCAFDLALFATAGSSVNCYGPSLTYTGHPDVIEGSADGQSGGGDAGIWDELEEDEACAVAQTNNLVDQVSGLVDTAINTFASMLCVVNVNGDTIPDAGAAALDMASSLQSTLTENGITGLTVSTATLEHQADDADGNDVYFFTITGSATDSGETRNITLYLKHIPLDSDNTTYKGKLSFAITDDSGTNLGNCNDSNTVGSNTSTTLVEAGSILYHKNSATNLTYRFQKGGFCNSSNMPLDTSSNYDISKSDAASEDNPDGYANGFVYYLFNLNPSDGTGSFAFSWVAGTGSENTRTLNLTLSDSGSGSNSGCAYFGYGPQVSDTSADLGSIVGMKCNWGMPASQDLTMRDYVQRQCVSYDSTTGKYLTDETLGSLAITYAPTDTCTTEAGNNFIYYSSFKTASDPATNDRYIDTSAVSNGMIDIADMVFTLPTEPDDVY